MNRSFRILWVPLAAVALAGLPGPAHAQKVKVFREISNERLEGVLKALAIIHKKSDNPLGGTIYDFTRSNFNIRLQNWNGSVLFIDAVFGRIPLEEVNRWNKDARLSRAVIVSGPIESCSLEAQLDTTAGVTEGIVRQFIQGFDKEVQAFSKFLRTVVEEEETFKAVSGERLEKILKSFKLEFTKTDDKEDCYEFEKSGQKVRLRCHEKGGVLVLETAFPKIPLEDVNKYNLNRRFVRVALKQDAKGKEFTSLESYLDCRGGVTEGMVRYFLSVFDQELIEFRRLHIS